MTEFNFDVLVIGSGPAGNTASIYLVRNGLKVAMISGMSIGGQLTTTTEVENFPGFPEPILGIDLMQKMMDQARNLGVEIVYDQVDSVNFSQKPFRCTTSSGDVYIADKVVISTGAGAKWLGLPSEAKFMGRGVSACATCDGSFYKNMDVAVVGGGLSAGTEALHLSHICNKVYLIHRRNNFKMVDSLFRKVRDTKNIEFVMESEVIEILGTEEPKAVSAVKVRNTKTLEEKEIPVKCVFMAIGRAPATEIFKNTGLHMDEHGYIITMPDSSRTNISGVYAVGDVANKPFKQAVIASGYGAIASMEVQQDMEK